jgi:hypothetical protein
MLWRPTRRQNPRPARCSFEAQEGFLHFLRIWALILLTPSNAAHTVHVGP